MGSFARYLREKSSRSSIRATVTVAARSSTSFIRNGPSQSPLWVISALSILSTFAACSTYVRALALISSSERRGRLLERPEGSPTFAV
jgi:hypothetical protein